MSCALINTSDYLTVVDSDMRTAFLISGDYRGFDYGVHTYVPLMKKCDVYVSTWNHTSQHCPLTGNEIFRMPVTEDRVLANLKDVSVKAVICEDLSCSPKSDIYNTKMVYRWRVGMNAILNSGIQYERVIYARPDLFFYDPQHLSSITDLDVTIKCYSAWYDQSSQRMPDIFAVGSLENMNKMLCDVETWHRYFSTYDGDWHKSYFKIIEDSGLDVLKLHVSTNFLRPPYLHSASAQFVNFAEYAWKLRIVKRQLSEYDYDFVSQLWPENIIREAQAFEFPVWTLKE